MHTNRILAAAQLANHWHAGQLRKHKPVPYTTHLIRVAGQTALHPQATEAMVCAAWLHDTIEDQATTPERKLEIETAITAIGPDILYLVQGLTNVSKATGLLRAERKRLDRERLAGTSREVKIIKLIDRIDNLEEMFNDLQTGVFKDSKFTRLYAEESRDLWSVALLGIDPALEYRFGTVLAALGSF